MDCTYPMAKVAVDDDDEEEKEAEQKILITIRVRGWQGSVFHQSLKMCANNKSCHGAKPKCRSIICVKRERKKP